MIYEINLKILKKFNFLKIKIKSIISKNIFKTKKIKILVATNSATPTNFEQKNLIIFLINNKYKKTISI
jgi:hypothetical protein